MNSPVSFFSLLKHLNPSIFASSFLPFSPIWEKRTLDVYGKVIFLQLQLGGCRSYLLLFRLCFSLCTPPAPESLQDPRSPDTLGGSSFIPPWRCSEGELRPCWCPHPRPSSLVVLWSVLHLYQNHFSKVTSSSKPQLFSASSSSAALATACFLSLMAVLCTLIMQNVPVSLPSGQEPSESFGLELSTLPSTCTLLRGASFSPGFGLPWKHKCTALALTFLCVVQTSASQDFEAGFSRGRIEYQRV